MKAKGKLLTIGALGLGAVITLNYIHKKSRFYNVRGKVVLITGGSRGLGLNLARQLIAEGAKVVICARDKDELENAFYELSETGKELLAIQCDVTNKLQVDKMILEIKQRLVAWMSLLTMPELFRLVPLRI